MTVRQLVRQLMEADDVDKPVVVRILKRGDHGTYESERHVPVERVSTVLSKENWCFVVVEESELEKAESIKTW